MSLGPTIKDEQFQQTFAQRVNIVVKQGAKAYFERPFFYLFFVLVPVTMIALFFGMRLSPGYLFCLSGIGIATAFNAYHKNDKI